MFHGIAWPLAEAFDRATASACDSASLLVKKVPSRDSSATGNPPGAITRARQPYAAASSVKSLYASKSALLARFRIPSSVTESQVKQGTHRLFAHPKRRVS